MSVTETQNLTVQAYLIFTIGEIFSFLLLHFSVVNIIMLCSAQTVSIIGEKIMLAPSFRIPLFHPPAYSMKDFIGGNILLAL